MQISSRLAQPHAVQKSSTTSECSVRGVVFRGSVVPVVHGRAWIKLVWPRALRFMSSDCVTLVPRPRRCRIPRTVADVKQAALSSVRKLFVRVLIGVAARGSIYLSVGRMTGSSPMIRLLHLGRRSAKLALGSVSPSSTAVLQDSVIIVLTGLLYVGSRTNPSASRQQQ